MSKSPDVFNAVNLRLKRGGHRPLCGLMQRPQEEDTRSAELAAVGQYLLDVEQDRLPNFLVISFGVGRRRHRC